MFGFNLKASIQVAKSAFRKTCALASANKFDALSAYVSTVGSVEETTTDCSKDDEIIYFSKALPPITMDQEECTHSDEGKAKLDIL